MSGLSISERPPSLAHYLGVLKRRKWVALPPVVLIPLIAYFLSLQQTPEYQATAEVLLGRQDVVAAAADVPNPNSVADPERLAATQSAVARSPLLAQKAVAAADVPGLTVSGLLAASDVSPRANADVLEFRVRGTDPDTVTRLASVYAGQYIIFRRDLDTKALNEAMQNLQAKIDRLTTGGVSSESPLYTQLLDAQTKLETAATLQTANAVVLQPAQGAEQIAPTPERTALLGGLLGIVIGLALAFLAEALDSRVRSGQEVEERLAIPLLGMMPRPRIRLRRSEVVVMLAKPNSRAAEAVRQLRANLDFARAGAGARTILVTSAVDGEGKSTTAANLAVAFARAGRRVVLVDLDLRHPRLHQFFKTDSHPGVTDATVGRAKLDDAVTTIVASDSPLQREPGLEGARSTFWQTSTESSNGQANSPGSLQLLTAGTKPRDPGEFVAGAALAELLTELRSRADLVLIDSPPMLNVGDAAVLSARVDAMLVVFRLGVTRRSALVGLGRQLEKCPAAKLGFVATDAVRDGGYGFYREEYGASEPALTGRPSV